MAGPYGPRYSGVDDQPQQSPYGFQGEPQPPAPVPQERQRLSGAGQQEAAWLEQQQREEEAAQYGQQPRRSRGGSYGGQDPYAAQDPYAGQGAYTEPAPYQQDPYASYPHEAPYQQAPPEQDVQRLTEDEYFDPYAPAAGAGHTHRRTSSTEGGYPTMYPPIYQDTDLVRPLPVGPDGRELPPVQPGQEPPPAHLPAYEYAAANLQSSYAPPSTGGGKYYSSNAREQLGTAGGSGLPPADGKNFSAPAFTKTYDIEAKPAPPSTGHKQRFVFERPFNRQTRPNILGWLLMIFYLCALIFYIYVRAAKTLNLGAKYQWYGIVILVIEIIGSTTTIVYGLNHLFYTVDKDIPGKKPLVGPLKTATQYHIRCLVPCYKESLQILQLTIMALRESELPEGCTRTIYMCDDGKDPLKRDWVDSLGPDVIYVSGRTRKKGEMNGKSGNMNNVLQQIYPTGCFIPPDELIAVFDADQVAKPDFFLKMTPMFDAGDNIGMVLSPQYNSNLSATNDIFNHSNLHFWQYMQTGYDALDFISCTGTNFMVRANAYQEAGWTPTWTLTEDFALGMEMKRNGWHCRYLNQYLAVGEAPDGVRNCFQQRSRWTKGHFQIIMNRKYCPLFRAKLDWLSRMLYVSGVWSYVINAVTTPIFMAVPIITIWVGVFPMIVNFWMALGSTIYIVANCCVLYYFRNPMHLPALWFAGLANQLFWWTYAKAMWRSFTAACCCSSISFKATAKGGSKVGNSGFRDMWIHGLTLTINMLTIAVGLVQVFTGAVIVSPLLISIIWCLYNSIPPILLFTYAIAGRKYILSFMCFLAMIVSTAAVIASLGFVWWIQGQSGYNPQQFTGGAAQNPTYIGFIQTVKRWIRDGVNGVTKLTGGGDDNNGN
jgi:cellulose synthase/poly-beta-1,6-N-acetylglucosamine synthase-like glycosyltransferase